MTNLETMESTLEMSATISNRTFDELSVGDTAAIERTLSRQDIDLFAAMSGDVNPAHMDEEYARHEMFHGVVGHGMWVGALISTVLGTELPGPGTIYLGQSLRFRAPVKVGDSLRVVVTVKSLDAERKRAVIDCLVTNQSSQIVVSGEAEILVPTEKVSRPRIATPRVYLRKPGDLMFQIVRKARALGRDPVRCAVVHPVDDAAISGTFLAALAGLIEPILVGPAARIREAAEKAEVDISGFELIDTPHSHAAAELAVQLAREGRVASLMKGALHTDELMRAAIDRASGLRTDRRISHVFVIDVPSYHKPLLISDAAINVLPDLEAKADIVRNAIGLAHALGVERPKVAVLSAVETVNPDIESTLHAAALCKMAQRGQISGAILDGPLAFDNAISAVSARTKQIDSPVAGDPDVLIAPNLEAANMLAKQLAYLADAQVAGIVLGTRVPIMLTSRADGPVAREASCALAALWQALPKEQR